MERIADVRIGTRVHTDHGTIVNGKALRKDQRDDLIAQGFRLVPYDGKPEPPNVDQAAVDAANRILGLNTLPDGRKQIEADLAKTERELLAPLKKSFYFTD